MKQLSLFPEVFALPDPIMVNNIIHVESGGITSKDALCGEIQLYVFVTY